MAGKRKYVWKFGSIQRRSEIKEMFPIKVDKFKIRQKPSKKATKREKGEEITVKE